MDLYEKFAEYARGNNVLKMMMRKNQCLQSLTYMQTVLNPV